MKEEILHFVWKKKRFDLQDLRTTNGQRLEIVDFGRYNQNAGPDFLEARIRLGETVWAGSVEMHIRASEWKRHRHGDDKAYDNVILHVVFEEDERIQRRTGGCIPCLELGRRIHPYLLANYKLLMQRDRFIPCSDKIPFISKNVHLAWQERLVLERLDAKTHSLEKMLKKNGYDWEQSFFQLFVRHLGLKVNADSFEALATSLPLKVLLRHRANLTDLEALLFGQAGFLNQEYEEAYPVQLRENYEHLRRKNKLYPMDGSVWKFLRLRPANFPTIRIAQLARLMFQSDHLFGKALAAEGVGELERMLDLHLSGYWLTHYQFDKPSARRQKSLGKATVHNLVINAVVPILYLYGKTHSKSDYCEKAVLLLKELPPENNTIIKRWAALNVEAGSASQSQALLHLKNMYCEQNRCLNCAIGVRILEKAGREEKRN